MNEATTREAILAAIAGRPYDVVTKDNSDRLRTRYAHPFFDQCRIGDLIWSVPRIAIGDSLAVVWFADGEPPRGGFGRTQDPTLHIGTVIVLDGRLLLVTEETDGARFDLLSGKELSAS